MILGMTLLTFVHVLISLVGLGSGFVVLAGMLTARRLDGWHTLFLSSTVATSLSGFILPADRFLPSHAIGIVSIVVLAVALYARYGRREAGSWKGIYVVTALIALYLNLFVGVVQGFLRVPALRALAPTQSEAPFQLTQLVVLTLFVGLGIAAVLRTRRGPRHASAPASLGPEPG